MGAFFWKFLNSNLPRCHQLWPNKWASAPCTQGPASARLPTTPFGGHGLTASLPLKICQAPKGKGSSQPLFFRGEFVKLCGCVFPKLSLFPKFFRPFKHLTHNIRRFILSSRFFEMYFTNVALTRLQP